MLGYALMAVAILYIFFYLGYMFIRIGVEESAPPMIVLGLFLIVVVVCAVLSCVPLSA